MRRLGKGGFRSYLGSPHWHAAVFAAAHGSEMTRVTSEESAEIIVI